MKKVAYIWLLLIAVAPLRAQDYFAETQARAQAATLHEAIYIWSDYQQFNPAFHAPYFHLGQLYYHRLQTEHPIRDYNELKESVYRTRLYFGNCLHYAKDQNLKSIYYAGVPYAGKRPEYSELETFINRRLDTVALIDERAERIYTSYNRIVDLNDLCRNLFTDFVEKYVREKTAHLLLTPDDLSLLLRLQTMADSIPEAISALNGALADYPLSDYQPQFTSQPIVLYRLDGLTRVNIFQNDVALWDYAGWVREFMKTHNESYAAFYAAVADEYAFLRSDIEHMQTGKKRQHKPNYVLLNRINRIDYQSFMIDFLSLAQQASLILEERLDTVFRPTSEITDDYKEQALTILYRQYEQVGKTRALSGQLTKRLTADGLKHYLPIADKLNIRALNTVKLQADTFKLFAEDGYRQSCRAFADNIRPTCAPFKAWVNELTNERFTADNLQFTFSDSLISILPVDTNYLVVFHRPCVVLCDKDGYALRTTEYKTTSPIMAAVKYGSNTIALVCEDRILFVDNTGKEKVFTAQ